MKDGILNKTEIGIIEQACDILDEWIETHEEEDGLNSDFYTDESIRAAKTAYVTMLRLLEANETLAWKRRFDS